MGEILYCGQLLGVYLDVRGRRAAFQIVDLLNIHLVMNGLNDELTI
jgi:hypothetical protein